MAKGRKSTASRSQRYLESVAGHGYYGGGDETQVTEFTEEDVWSVGGDAADMNRDRVEDFSRDWSRHVGIGAMGRGSVVPQHYDHRVGGLSVAFEDSSTANTTAFAASPRIVLQHWGNDGAAAFPRGGRQMASSAPVDVLDWSKIYRTDSVDSGQGSDNGYEDPELEMVPPHEYVAREYARSRKMMAPSVFEGQGRTLKGRDLSRVRDAVWSQTGFDG